MRGNADQEDNDLLDDIDSEWDLGDDPVQHLYLSRSTKRMMEVINNRFAIVYTRKNISEPGNTVREMANQGEDQVEVEVEDDGQLVEWELDYNITRWPSLLCQRTTAPFLFSPNFTY